MCMFRRPAGARCACGGRPTGPAPPTARSRRSRPLSALSIVRAAPEEPAHALTKRATLWNILGIRPARREPSRSGPKRVEPRVYTLARRQPLAQRLAVGAPNLLYFLPLQPFRYALLFR